MSDLDALCRDLVTANHILAREGVTDALGHISVRHPDRPDRFFLSCSRSPELVKLDDIMEYDLDCNPVYQRGRPMYVERPIHGAIYRARPDVISVVHNHAYEVIPFGLTRKPLRACVHTACVVVGTNIRLAVMNAVYFKVNAGLVLQSMLIGDEITYLSEGEVELTKKIAYAENAVTRMWDYWSRRCGDAR